MEQLGAVRVNNRSSWSSNSVPSPRHGRPRPRRYVSRELRRSSTQSFAVRIEREADVPLVVHGLNRRGSEPRSLLVEHFDALWKRDATEIHQGGDKASRDLGRARAGHPDLVESQMNVVLPGHRLHEQSNLAVLIRNATVGERPTRELSEDVVQAVDRLHGRRGVLKWRLRQRALRDVDQEPHPVSDVLVESRLELQAQRREEPVLVQVARDSRER